MDTYTEYRLYVKYTNRGLPTHVANVDNPFKWVQGHGLPFVLNDDKFGGVDYIKIVRYNGIVGSPAVRGKDLIMVSREAFGDEQKDIPVR